MADISKLKKRPARKKKPEQQEKKTFLSVFRRKDKDSSSVQNQSEATIAGNGQVIQDKGAMLGKVFAWCFVAFVGVAAVLSFMNASAPASTAERVVQVGQTPEEQQAADYARGYVGAWLRATEEDDSEISRYMQIERGDITATEASEYRDLSVASTNTDDNGVSTVIVSAEVLTVVDVEAQDDEENEKQEVWQPTWYQVNVYQEEGRFVPLGWPAPIPAPETAGAPRMAYSHDAPDEITDTIADFFEAYVLGEGEVTRLTHPDSTIQPLGTEQYSYAEVRQVTTDEDHDGTVPEDETTTRAFVQLHLGDDAATARSATYALTLETRGGRWEVRTLDSAPVVDNSQLSAEADEAAVENEQLKNPSKQ